MVTTLEHGITVHGDAEGAIVQAVEVTAKKEENTVSGMVSGKTQIVKSFEHTETNEFSVTGKGDFTFVPGLAADPDITLITGGITFVADFKYGQKIGETSEWSYNGRHYPHGS